MGLPVQADRIALASSSSPTRFKPVYEVAVNSEIICKVKHSIRWKDNPWTEEQCEARAIEFGEAADQWNLDPAVLLAMGINESDLRSICHKSGRGIDCGILGVRCVQGSDGKCKNKPVRGFTPATLLRPSINIHKGAEILATLHGGNLASYNGGPRAKDDTYPTKISALLSALGGVDVFAKHRKLRKETRMEKLTRTISQAVQP
jgi:hypothetical protein